MNRVPPLVLAVHRLGSLLSHVSCRWRQGIVGDLRGHAGWKFLHQSMPVQNNPPRNHLLQCPVWWLSSVIAEAPVRVSPVMGCKLAQCRHHYRLQTASCLQCHEPHCSWWKGSPLWGRRAHVPRWSDSHRHSWWGCLRGASHTLRP